MDDAATLTNVEDRSGATPSETPPTRVWHGLHTRLGSQGAVRKSPFSLLAAVGCGSVRRAPRPGPRGGQSADTRPRRATKTHSCTVALPI